MRVREDLSGGAELGHEAGAVRRVDIHQKTKLAGARAVLHVVGHDDDGEECVRSVVNSSTLTVEIWLRAEHGALAALASGYVRSTSGVRSGQRRASATVIRGSIRTVVIFEPTLTDERQRPGYRIGHLDSVVQRQAEIMARAGHHAGLDPRLRRVKRPLLLGYHST